MSAPLWVRPPFLLRAAIVGCGLVGLLIGDHRVVYFTAQSNLIVLAYFVGALYWMVQRSTVVPPAPRWRGAVTLWILITCLISHFMLNHGENPLPGLVGAGAVANWSLFLVHYVVPVLVLADWVAFGPHRVVRWRDIPLWIAYPLGYGLMIEIRGALFPSVPIRYPYFFLDPAGHGYGWVGLQFVELAVIFGLLGVVVVGLDRLAGRAGDRGRKSAPEAIDARPGPA
ncbi:Pr6Pr family membrane protein [Paractinoplanes globisporus]|uniref:Pr6Pr family membrane protein n=1 Tax=Paractinoplanes globisporus TaxID=113565 RepID=A0ABW6W5A1_9ACTN|nr:Pr6Pr family membrane protein [Actinoplanes globisporus]